MMAAVSKRSAAGCRDVSLPILLLTHLLLANNSHAFTGIVRMSPAAAPAGMRARARQRASLSQPAAPSSTEQPAVRSRSKLRMAVDGGELSFSEKFAMGWTTVIPAGDPEELPPCPSGVSSKPKPVQAAIFAGVFVALAAGTLGILAGLASLEAALPPGWYTAWQASWAPFLGLAFAAAGVSHFTILQDFCNIYPGKGAWGFWYLPGTASFHVKWTGIAEFVGGVGLALGWVGVSRELGLEQAAAAGLCALTLAVTPANIYMFTHGAQLPEGLEVPVAGHFVRGVLQCVLLAFFFTLANQ